MVTRRFKRPRLLKSGTSSFVKERERSGNFPIGGRGDKEGLPTKRKIPYFSGKSKRKTFFVVQVKKEGSFGSAKDSFVE